MFSLQRLLLNSALILCMAVVSSCSQDERCDDCSRIAEDRIRFKIETIDGVNLFFGDDAIYDPVELEIYYFKEGELVNNGLVRSTSDFFSTHLEIGRGNQFIVQFDDKQDTINVETEHLPSDCEGCPEMDIVALYFNDQLVCDASQDCEEVLTFVVD